jgi:hypothetical protein
MADDEDSMKHLLDWFSISDHSYPAEVSLDEIILVKNLFVVDETSTKRKFDESGDEKSSNSRPKENPHRRRTIQPTKNYFTDCRM